MAYSPLLSKKIIKDITKSVPLESIENLSSKLEKLNLWRITIDSGNLDKTKETSLQGTFLNDIFLEILDYKGIIGNQVWNLNHEARMLTDSTSPDGALGFFSESHSDIQAVIELKNAMSDLDAKQYRKNDKRTPVEQAFSYVPKTGGNCKWVIVSNFKELRLYHSSDVSKYEVFKIRELSNKKELHKFYSILNGDSLIVQSGIGRVEKLFRQNEDKDEQISEEFYKKYKVIRLKLISHINKNNKKIKDLESLNFAQRILDRFIFVCFCEDHGLIPTNTIRGLVERAKKSISLSDQKIWTNFKELFEVLDKGSKEHHINKFNGGLFRKNKQLNKIKVSNKVLAELSDLTKYNFNSDLNVNILGHIFEQSVTDLEEIKSEFLGISIKKQQSEKNVRGLVYTPRYIVSYIVRTSLGLWREKTKIKLGFDKLPELSEKDYKSIKQISKGKRKGRFEGNTQVEKWRDCWFKYRKELMNIKVIDPACGSGAFLNEVFDFLYYEGQYVNERIAELRLGQAEVFDLGKHILSKNMFGVDLSPESVELTKLSLWIKTANSRNQLTSLDQNIVCGDSLVSDKSISDRALIWEKTFSSRFDVVVGNPPYDVVSEKETGQGNVDKFKGYIKKDPILSLSASGKHNLYKLFICRSIWLLKKAGVFSFIVPMSLMGDKQAVNVRKYLLNNTQLKIVDGFPQKDNPQKRVFKHAKLSTCIFVCSKQKPDQNTEFIVRIHPGKQIETPYEKALTVNTRLITKLDPKNEPIPSCNKKDWKIMKKVLAIPYYTQLGTVAKQYQGEVNETMNEAFLHEDDKYVKVLRGANITLYKVRKASQGEIKYINDMGFLKAKKAKSKSFHFKLQRIGFQRSSPQNNFRRLIAAPIPKGVFCFDTVSYVTSESCKIPMPVLLGLLNSKLYDWFFRLTSTNSKVNEYQFNNLPCFNITEKKSSKEQQALIKEELWAPILNEVEEEISANNIVPSWTLDVIEKLSNLAVTSESKRKLTKRSDRSSLGTETKKIQRYLDEIICTIFQIDSLEQKYIEARIKKML